MTRKQMTHESMVITERWRWRLLTTWVIVFTLLTSYAIFKVRDVSKENRDSLCSIHLVHVTTDRALKQLMEKAGMDVAPINLEIKAEDAALADLRCGE